MITLIEKAHSSIVFARRVRVLAELVGAMIPAGASVLDVGCGDGTIAGLIQAERPDVTVEGLDVMVRPSTKIPVTAFDGRTLPAADDSYDVVLFIDVLHHTLEPGRLLAEAARVARETVIVKDHVADNAVDHSILSLMDWVGNAPHGVVLPYNYQSGARWESLYAQGGLRSTKTLRDVPLYPWPLSMVFGRALHFVSALTPARAVQVAA